MDIEDPLNVSKNTAFERYKNGYFSDALSAEKNALKLAEDRYGPTHVELVPFLIDLATIDRTMARYADAESSLKWALALQEKDFGADDPKLADTLAQLTSLYTDWGNWLAAYYFGTECLTILQKHKSTSTEDLTQAWNNLGIIDMESGNINEAKNSFLNQSLAVQEIDSKLNPSNLILTLNLLSKAYQVDKADSKAQSCLQRVLDISKKYFADNSIQVADAMENLGNFYQSQNQADQAKNLLEGALPIYQSFVGVYFGYRALDDVHKLAKAYKSVGKNKEAEDLLQKSLQTLKEVFGPSHPRVALGLLDLAQQYDETKQA